MRVITGDARGCRLKAPEGNDVRPTPERVKEAIFSMLHADLPDTSFLDLFCGSGQMGIEALSRGAKRAVFVDASPASLYLAKENLAHCRLQEKGETVRSGAKEYLIRCQEKFDIIFLDPPYSKNLIPELLPLAANCLKKDGILIAESEKRDPLPEKTGNLTLSKQNQYGVVKISVYRPAENEEE